MRETVPHEGTHWTRLLAVLHAYSIPASTCLPRPTLPNTGRKGTVFTHSMQAHTKSIALLFHRDGIELNRVILNPHGHYLPVDAEVNSQAILLIPVYAQWVNPSNTSCCFNTCRERLMSFYLVTLILLKVTSWTGLLVKRTKTSLLHLLAQEQLAQACLYLSQPQMHSLPFT